MVKRLPPLKSIEAFVIVAKLLSFSKAALELNISKSAVSRRIQALEADLDIRLIERGANSVQLTAAGQTYYDLTGPAFATLHRAALALDGAHRRSVLKIALPESFASVWLMPRLSDFYARHRDSQLHLDSAGYFEQQDLRDVDVLIRVNRDKPAHHHAERLMALSQFPVCSPDLLSRTPLRTIDDLRDRPLIMLTTMADAWGDWLHHVGRPDLQPQKVLSFDTMSLVMRAAASGLGVAMGFGELCERELAEGRLVAPFPQKLIGSRSLYFVCRQADVSKRSVRRFRNWLMEESVATSS
jgi:LysR family glycine cleavage system transcriptional activator